MTKIDQVAQYPRHVAAVVARAVDYARRFDAVAALADERDTVIALRGSHGKAQPEFRAVRLRVLSEREDQIEGIDDGRRGRKQRADHRVRERRLERVRLFRAHDLQTFDTVLFPAREQFVQPRRLFARRRHGKRARTLIRHLQRRGIRAEHIRAANVVLRHERTRQRVVTRMDDPAVRAARARTHVESGFRHHDARLVSGQLTRDGTADGSSSDDAKVIHTDIILYPHGNFNSFDIICVRAPECACFCA